MVAPPISEATFSSATVQLTPKSGPGRREEGGALGGRRKRAKVQGREWRWSGRCASGPVLVASLGHVVPMLGHPESRPWLCRPVVEVC